jgi:excisionase family DNA binding protein
VRNNLPTPCPTSTQVASRSGDFNPVFLSIHKRRARQPVFLAEENMSPIDVLSDDNLLAEYLSLPKPEREERFITTSRAADLTGLSIRTIQSWAEYGYVRSFTIGKKYRIDRISLIEFLSGSSPRSSLA